MARKRNRIYTTVETERGLVEVAINRRGCKGRWTKKDAEAMEAIVRAAVLHVEGQRALTVDICECTHRRASHFRPGDFVTRECTVCPCRGFRPGFASLGEPLNDTQRRLLDMARAAVSPASDGGTTNNG